jgi:hypothetical protein
MMVVSMMVVRLLISSKWHPTLSARDQEWTEETLRKVFGERPLDELTLKEFGAAFVGVLTGIDSDPSKRTFGGCVRF